MTTSQPLWQERALMVGNLLIVADLHIGYEIELGNRGFSIPSQTSGMIEGIKGLLVETGADTLVINGDLKHNIPRGSWQEYREIPLAMDTWLKVVKDIHMVKGNHDGNIERYLPSEVTVHGSGGAVIGGVGFFHGHAIPDDHVMETRLNVFAHAHPAVALYDGLGRREKYPCWVRLKYSFRGVESTGILIPNYNHLLGGICINQESYLGPFHRSIDIREERVYLLDGTCLGERRDIIPDDG